MKLSRTYNRKARVEMIPLIDCMFIVLVFFIYSMLSMVVQQGIMVKLPEAASASDTAEQPVIITVTRDGTLMINNDLVSRDDFGILLASVTADIESPTVVINADTEAQHGWVTWVMGQVRQQKIFRVMVLSKEGPQP